MYKTFLVDFNLNSHLLTIHKLFHLLTIHIFLPYYLFRGHLSAGIVFVGYTTFDPPTFDPLCREAHPNHNPNPNQNSFSNGGMTCRGIKSTFLCLTMFGFQSEFTIESILIEYFCVYIAGL